jgi:hypothetical protein
VVAFVVHLKFLFSKERLPADMVSQRYALMVIAMGLCAACLGGSVYNLLTTLREETIWVEDLIAQISLSLTYLLALPLHYMNHIKSRRPSNQLCTAYIGLTFYYAVDLYSRSVLGQTWNQILVPAGIAMATVVLFITENCSIKMKETRKEYIDISVPTPEYYASYLFKVLFLWVSSLIVNAKKKPLQFEDLWDLPKYLKAETCSDNFQRYFDQQVAQKTEKPVTGALYTRYRNRIILLGLLTNGLMLLSFLNPLMIDYLLRFIQSQNSDSPQAIESGLMVAFAYLGIQLVSAALAGQQYHYLFMQGIDIFQSLMSLVYKKSLRVDLNTDESVGKVVDLICTDALGIGSSNYFVVMLSSAPLQLLIAMWMIYSRIGWSSLIFLAMLVVSTPALDKIRALTGKYKVEQFKHKDVRVSLCNDGLGGMKSLKLYGWTELIANKIQSKRTQELSSLKQMKTVVALSKMFSVSLLSISTLLMFGVSLLMSNDLTPEKIFVTLSLVSMLEGPMTMIFQASGFFGLVQASLRRMEEFMREKDIQRIVDRYFFINVVMEQTIRKMRLKSSMGNLDSNKTPMFFTIFTYRSKKDL